MFELRDTEETAHFARKIAIALKACYEANAGLATPNAADEAQVYLGLSELLDLGQLVVIVRHPEARRVIAMTDQEWATLCDVEANKEQRSKAYIADVLLAWLSSDAGPALPKAVADACLGLDMDGKLFEDYRMIDDDDVTLADDDVPY